MHLPGTWWITSFNILESQTEKFGFSDMYNIEMLTSFQQENNLYRSVSGRYIKNVMKRLEAE